MLDFINWPALSSARRTTNAESNKRASGQHVRASLTRVRRTCQPAGARTSRNEAFRNGVPHHRANTRLRSPAHGTQYGTRRWRQLGKCATIVVAGHCARRRATRVVAAESRTADHRPAIGAKVGVRGRSCDAREPCSDDAHGQQIRTLQHSNWHAHDVDLSIFQLHRDPSWSAQGATHRTPCVLRQRPRPSPRRPLRLAFGRQTDVAA